MDAFSSDGLFLTADEMAFLAGHFRNCPSCGRDSFALWRHDSCGRFIRHEDATEYRCWSCYKRVPRSAVDELLIGHAYKRYVRADREDYPSFLSKVFLGLAEFPEVDSD